MRSCALRNGIITIFVWCTRKRSTFVSVFHAIEVTALVEWSSIAYQYKTTYKSTELFRSLASSAFPNATEIDFDVR